MAIDAYAGLSSATSSSSTASSYANGNSIAENFDAFLRLLTTQLQNQNPLEPLDTNQFMQELVQFSSVEQQIKTNDYMEKLVTSLSGQATSAVVGYLDKTVTANNSTTEFANGSAKWSFDIAGATETIGISVRDENGTVVHHEELAGGNSGTYTYTWDGSMNTGQTATSGTYKITVDARDSDDKSVSVSTQITGKVTAVDLSGSEPILSIGDYKVKLSNVESVAV